ncbi:YwiC-like family protein [Brevibacillus sp. GCM10020057]|uniref:YwiC-like family protein n=1 Tax=Brevibacillus sp. GCM10020057 TaxID=3317327 RepID=UPI00362B3851
MQIKLFKAQKVTYLLPHEHGVWAMMLVPFLLGLAMGQARWQHLLLGGAIVAGYFAVHGVLTILRKPKKFREALPTVTMFGLLGLLLGGLPFATNPAAFLPFVWMVPFLAASVWFVVKKRERDFANDVCAIVAFTMLLPVAAGLGDGEAAGAGTSVEDVALGMLLNVLYFIGSVFFVKSVFRERNNTRFTYIGIAYHAALLLLPLLLHAPLPILLLYLPGALKMLYVLRKPQFRAMQVGLLEIAGAAWFLGVAVWLFRGGM